MTEADNTADIFSEMDTAAMLFAYFHRTDGMAGLQRFLAAAVENAGEGTKPCLIKAADELMEMEMPATARAVLETAATLAEPENPFPENTPNWRDWNRRQTGSFEGFYFDDGDRVTLARQLRSQPKGN